MTERNEPMTEARLVEIEEDAQHFGGSIEWRVKELTAEIRRLKQERDELLTLLEKALIGAKHESCLRTSRLIIADPDPMWHCGLIKEIEEVLKKAKGAQG